MAEEPCVRCRHCTQFVPAEENFCPHCGTQLTEMDRRIGSADVGGAKRQSSDAVRKAVKWMIALGVMFIIFGTIFGFIQMSTADHYRTIFASFGDDEILTNSTTGESISAGELRKQIEVEVYSIFVLNYLLGLVMFGLSFWARRSPFPAMVTALCIYLAVIALNAVVDPSTIVQGILIKILFFGALIAGIKAALEARRLAESPAGDPVTMS